MSLNPSAERILCIGHTATDSHQVTSEGAAAYRAHSLQLGRQLYGWFAFDSRINEVPTGRWAYTWPEDDEGADGPNDQSSWRVVEAGVAVWLRQ